MLVTGAAGFLGSHAVRHELVRGHDVVGLDALTYAGDPARLEHLVGTDSFRFVRADVADRDAVRRILGESKPQAVLHFAAETHVTRSESQPERFIRANVEGTRVMLEESARANVRRFLHVSTDEVYGPISAGAFREEDKSPGPGRATSPYARSKALADDLAASWGGRGGLRVTVVRPTNCFGPSQFPEKALARWITRALSGLPLPVWGDGRYVRQWVHAADLMAALAIVMEEADPAPAYNVGPRHEPEVTNVELARWLLQYLDLPDGLLQFTDYDRPDHDIRYAVDPSRIEALGWRPGNLHEQLVATVEWYRANQSWWRRHVAEAESIYVDVAPSGVPA